jgi:hypothetical protein
MANIPCLIISDSVFKLSIKISRTQIIIPQFILRVIVRCMASTSLVAPPTLRKTSDTIIPIDGIRMDGIQRISPVHPLGSLCKKAHILIE